MRQKFKVSKVQSFASYLFCSRISPIIISVFSHSGWLSLSIQNKPTADATLPMNGERYRYVEYVDIASTETAKASVNDVKEKTVTSSLRLMCTLLSNCLLC